MKAGIDASPSRQILNVVLVVTSVGRKRLGVVSVASQLYGMFGVFKKFTMFT